MKIKAYFVTTKEIEVDDCFKKFDVPDEEWIKLFDNGTFTNEELSNLLEAVESKLNLKADEELVAFDSAETGYCLYES